jgi:hypothetical protein
MRAIAIFVIAILGLALVSEAHRHHTYYRHYASANYFCAREAVREQRHEWRAQMDESRAELREQKNALREQARAQAAEIKAQVRESRDDWREQVQEARERREASRERAHHWESYNGFVPRNPQ